MKCRLLIAGAGISGLTLALALHARGIRSFKILERSKLFEESGSGINLLPLATRELADLGLLGELELLSVQVDCLSYTTWDGQLIWNEPKGRSAGFSWPQLSISRSRLHGVLLRSVIERCGADVLVASAPVIGVRRSRDEVVALCANNQEFAADLIVGADGIRSAVRNSLFPDLPALRVVPTTVYRGSYWDFAMYDNKTMYICGDGQRKFVVYPMFIDSAKEQVQINWAAAIPDSEKPKRPIGNWNVPALAEEISPVFHCWSLKGITPEHAICNSTGIYAYPMVDIDPLPKWSNGENILLIGDAAHGMYPIGSNGATQSIVDAVAFAQYLATSRDIPKAISAFEENRMPAVQAIQLANRKNGPEIVIDIAAERRKKTGDLLDIAFPYEERLKIASSYANLTNVTQASVNKFSPYKWIAA